MDPLDSRHIKFREILAWYDTFEATVRTEADTRFKLIDRILTEVLGWPRESLSLEEDAGVGKLDYKLVINSSTRCVVEAKRTSVSFNLEQRQSGGSFKLNGPAFNDAAKEAIKQVIGYCAFKNAELACVSNGSEWIIFRANRLGDGKDTLEGKGFAFSCLKTIDDNFSLFHDLISFEGIQGLKFRGLFQEAEGYPIRDLSFFKSLRLPGSKHLQQRSSFAKDFDKVMESFFQRLKGEDDLDMITDCFVVTRESEAAEDRICRIADELVGRMKQIDSQTGEQLLELIHSVQHAQRNRFVLLVGNKGAGKSTFIDRFFKHVLPAPVHEGLVVIRLDLAQCDGSVDKVAGWLNRELLRICDGEVFSPGGPSWEDTIGAMFFDEYQRWSNGSMKHLYDTDKNQFRIEFGRHVEKMREDNPHDVVKRLLRHIVRSRRRVPCLIFDNTDHHNIAFQEAVFQYARSVYESDLCLVIIPITDRTSWQLSRQGALQSFESEVLYLPVPEPHRVIERRIAYLQKKLGLGDQKAAQDYFFGRGIRLDIKNITAFAESLNKIFVESKVTSEWIGGLANYDIRRLLEITREVIASPHLPLEELLKAYISKELMSVPEWKMKHAIIKRSYDIYPEGEHPYVQNIYNLNAEIPTTPLLGLRVLQFLRDAAIQTDRSRREFVPIEMVYDHLSALGVERRTTRLWMQELLRTALVLDYDPTVTGMDDVTKVEVSPSGKVHLIWGTTDEEYIKPLKEVTPVRDRDTYDAMTRCSGNYAVEWAKSVALFVDYLIDEDSKWCKIPDHPIFDGQKSISRRLQRVKEGVLRWYQRRTGGEQPHQAAFRSGRRRRR